MGLPILDFFTILVSVGALAMFVIGGIAAAAGVFPFLAIAAFIRVLMWVLDFLWEQMMPMKLYTTIRRED